MKLFQQLLLLILTVSTLASICVAYIHESEEIFSVKNTGEFIYKGLKQPVYQLESKSPFHKTITLLSEKDGELTSDSTSYYTYPNASELQEYYADRETSDHESMIALDLKNWMPTYIGSVVPNRPVLKWKAPCFEENEGHLEAVQTPEGPYVKLTVISSKPKSRFCTDWYFIATRQSYHIKGFFFRGKHVLTLGQMKPGEFEDVLKHGIRMFVFLDGLLGTLIDVYHTLRVLYDAAFYKDKIEFYSKNMNMSFVDRPVKMFYFDEQWIESGDLITRTTMNAYDGFIMYGTGGHVGHVATPLRINGTMYITESTDVGIRRTPYRQWMENHDPNNQMVIIHKLHPDIRKRFDEQKAVEFFLKHEGLPYGYRNLAFSWIDTPHANYPKPMNSRILPAALGIFEAFFSDITRTTFIEGINQRFKYYYNVSSSCTKLECVFDICDKLNISIAKVVALVEQDDFTYPSVGKQMVCSSYVAQLYKAAGVFGEFTSSINGAEFTPKDLYQLQIFDENWQRPERCNVDKFKYCQPIGRWYWSLPGWNSIKMYKHMNERCGAIPPEYKRAPDTC